MTRTAGWLNGPVTMHWHRFLLAIRCPEPVGAGVEGVEQLFRDADSDDPGLVDGCIGSVRRPRGGYQFASVDSVQAAFPAAPWLTVDHPEPWIGAVCGFLNFEWWTDDVDYKEYYIGTWFGRSHGYLVDVPSGAKFDIIAQVRWPLAEAFDRHGFDDGDFFLTRAGEYLDVTRQVLARELTLAGVLPQFITYATHHNPLLVSAVQSAAVTSRFVDLWGFDLEMLTTPQFRRCILEDPTRPGPPRTASASG